MKRQQNKNVNKWSMNQLAKQRMQKVEMYTQVSTGIAWNAWQTTCKQVVWNDSHLACSFWASKHTYFLQLLLLLLATLEVLKIY